MNTVFKLFLSMSFSGALLILALFWGGRFLRDRISRQWQYYIWLIVILRLLLPFGPEANLMGKAYQAVDQAITRAAPLSGLQDPAHAPERIPAPAAYPEPEADTADSPAENPATAHPLQDIGTLLIGQIWLVWLMAALGMLIRKVTIYQGFVRYVHAGSTPVADIGILDRLSTAAQQAGVKRPIELCVNPLLSSPLLIGFIHPCIVLPGADIPEKDFQYIILHELTHYRRLDMCYKWLVQITVCLHWFNPLVHLMAREITRTCEFSCDEAILAKMGCGSAQDYGKTLLDAMAAVGRYKESLGAVTLNENKQLLKERLGAIMKFKERSRTVKILTAGLTLCVVFGAVFIGVHTMGTAAENALPAADVSNSAAPRSSSAEAERYYEAGSLPLFQIVFSRLDEEAQDKWLDKIYADNQIGFWDVAVNQLDEDSTLIQRYADKIYADGSIAYFSTLAMHMSEDTLEKWLDKALEDENWSFQSMLFNTLDRDDEFDRLKDRQEKEWEEAQAAEYRAAGVTMEGKDYYYQGQLVNLFLDIRPGKSFYTLNMNPAGTVNIKILRDEDNKITGVARMTEAEAAELLEDMDDGDDSWDDSSRQENAGGRTWHPKVIPVHLDAMTDGEIVWLGEYTLSDGDRIWYAVSAETGNGLQVGFAEPGDELLNEVYYSLHSLRQADERLECTASITFGPPVEPGTYELFLRAPDGALGNVRGSISIGFEADAS